MADHSCFEADPAVGTGPGASPESWTKHDAFCRPQNVRPHHHVGSGREPRSRRVNAGEHPRESRQVQFDNSWSGIPTPRSAAGSPDGGNDSTESVASGLGVGTPTSTPGMFSDDHLYCGPSPEDIAHAMSVQHGSRFSEPDDYSFSSSKTRLMIADRLWAWLGRLRHRDAGPRVALFVDGPNILRDEFSVDLDDIQSIARDAGRPVTIRLYLDERASPGLIRAAEARGFEVIVTSGDVDVRLAVDATRFVSTGSADILAIASRDTDFKPVLEAANAGGLRTLAIAPGAHGRSDALRNAATESVTLEE